MKQKRVLKGMLGFALVFALGMALASCGSQKAEIRVTNASQYDVDDVVSVSVYMQGRSDALASKDCSKNQSVSFSLDEGDYRVRVMSGGGSSFSFPQDGSAMKMSGDVRLRFNGSSVTRTN